MREQAALWYEQRATTEHGALGIMFRRHAERIRAGEADHRLPALIAAQAEYDAEQVPA